MIRLYDTLIREKREFVPQDPKRITMYVCGPTVYNRAHIGNFRPAVVFDVLARLLRLTYGPNSLVYARNITDIEDKIMAAAVAENVPIETITSRYAALYEEDGRALNVEPPDVEPFATGHIPDIIGMIGDLVANGHAYVAERHVLFDVASDAEYGVLSHRDRESMIAGARVDVAPYKRGPTDFVLWKPSTDDQPGWDSPWGRGRPGWHIECSAMIERHLGQTIDIHGGGLDLEFPHHENEIAQSRCAHGGAPLARYWVHNGMLSMPSGKMSKSLGNIVTVDELLAQGHRGEVLRLALLTGHYRQPLEWSDRLVAQSKATLDGLYRKVDDCEPGQVDGGVIEALSDDLNTPLALSRLNAIENARTLRATATLLGLLSQTADDWFRGGRGDDGKIEARIAERTAAKKNRDFATADRIREELRAEGIQLLDRADGTTDWERT